MLEIRECVSKDGGEHGTGAGTGILPPLTIGVSLAAGSGSTKPGGWAGDCASTDASGASRGLVCLPARADNNDADADAGVDVDAGALRAEWLLFIDSFTTPLSTEMPTEGLAARMILLCYAIEWR